MRIPIGKIVNPRKDLGNDLKPLDRVIAAATAAIINTKFYKRRIENDEAIKEEKRRKTKHALSEAILSIAESQFKNNELFGEDDECIAVLLKIPSKYASILPECVNSKEFTGTYNVQIIESEVKKIPMPILVYIKKREVFLT